MHTYLIEMLECPFCHGKLDWTITEKNDDRIEKAEVHCNICNSIYSVRDGIGIFLPSQLQLDDNWERADNGLVQLLRKNPELEYQLMKAPLDTLAPADQLFRSFVLEEQGNYIEAQIVEDSAKKGVYTPEYLNCWDRQMDYVIERLSTAEGPIVDIASGRCYLIEKIARRFKYSIVATDFSPKVLRRDRERLKSLGLYDHVSLLAFDARCTPFKNGAIATLSTNLGFSNIEKPGSLISELRRIVNGTFLAISNFFPEDDEENAKAIHEANLDALLYKHTALKHFTDAGWNVEVKNTCMGKAAPTPISVLLDGAKIDSLPVADTILEWCVLLGTNQLSKSK
jgi:uncharacterized protein YbaR (Trm112 family)